MESKHRFVLFPIQYHEVSISPTFYWLVADGSQDLAKYKKAEASFCMAEEMHLSKDMHDWNNRLNDNECPFVSRPHFLRCFCCGLCGRL
jgi:ribonucleoside-diphosphate reductase subunit M2